MDQQARRHNEGVLQFLERPALRWLSARMPGWVTPDMLTGLGFVGCLIATLGYVLSAKVPAFLWLASAGIALNWFGDSLDGNLARMRGIERKVYGFFLDNIADVLEYAIFAVGMGLSGYVRWELVLGTLAAFYMMMLLGLIKLWVTGIFQIAFGGTGLTELRIAFIAANVAMYFLPPKPFAIFGIVTTYPNVISAVWIASLVITFLVATYTTLRHLAALDPPPGRKSR